MSDLSAGARRCFSCGQTKPLSDYYRSNTRYYQRECKLCNRARKGRWHKTETGKLSSANTKLKRRFGISLLSYEAMLDKQGGCCKICGTSWELLEKKLAVDHDHFTGKVRGLLCNPCNLGLGNFQDSKERLTRAIAYLSDYPQHL